jgi:phage shock protein C
MYCSSCGIEIPDTFRFCSQCGTATAKDGFASSAGRPGRALRRPLDDKKIAGVCSGIARYLGVDVTLIRVLMTVLAIWPPGTGLVLYIVCWIVMPRDPLPLAAPPTDKADNVPARA